MSTKSAPNQKSIHKCPECKAVIHHKAKTCPSCKATFATEEHIVEKAQSNATSPKKPSGGSPNKTLQAKVKELEAKLADNAKQATATKVDRIAFLRVLKDRKFTFKVLVDPLDDDSTPEISGNADIKKLVDQINFGKMDEASKGLFCVSTEPTRFQLDLDTLLEIMKIPSKK